MAVTPDIGGNHGSVAAIVCWNIIPPRGFDSIADHRVILIVCLPDYVSVAKALIR